MYVLVCIGLFSFAAGADFGPGLSGLEGASEGRSAGRGVCFLRLSPPTLGLARRRRRRGAQLDEEFCSTPLATDFGSGLDGALEGCAALAWSLPFYLSLAGLSTGGQAMLGHWSKHHLRL